MGILVVGFRIILKRGSGLSVRRGRKVVPLSRVGNGKKERRPYSGPTCTRDEVVVVMTKFRMKMFMIMMVMVKKLLTQLRIMKPRELWESQPELSALLLRSSTQQLKLCEGFD